MSYLKQEARVIERWRIVELAREESGRLMTAASFQEPHRPLLQNCTLSLPLQRPTVNSTIAPLWSKQRMERGSSRWRPRLRAAWGKP